ncbi:MAG: glycosyltransferase family 2 protein [Ignavibacteriaceae bacterium]|jgi:glycosyltransferase involved in cell wall biosynthesis|nr:glycosyltransferase family 2 protein [Ignavibacteriaceae bacterium]MCW8824742.1 glycosyltransferase family 2 protein [Ignavibacteriaceae bacterium]MCW9096438.1 glycosyltransferase family 2 protein [Ignavibacteriaceae bacterium]
MIDDNQIVVIIPAYNEEESLPLVLYDIPDFVDEIIVANNGSTDNTYEVAKKAGATVVNEDEKGYGAACLKAMEKIKDEKFDIVVFLDGDYSDYPEEMNLVVEPIVKDDYDLVIGSRIIGKKGKGAMLPQAIFGNWLSSFLINLFWKYKFTDLGPFRAIKYSSLIKLNMKDRNFGWTVEMQIKAAKQKLKTIEVPVSYRKRIGQSKVTGTFKGTIKASTKILWLIFISLFKD